MTLFAEVAAPPPKAPKAPPRAGFGGHKCHAEGCDVAVPERMFMCRKHWYMLPKSMRDRVWELYVPGQETRKDPTAEYLDHAQACIDYIARLERRR